MQKKCVVNVYEQSPCHITWAQKTENDHKSENVVLINMHFPVFLFLLPHRKTFKSSSSVRYVLCGWPRGRDSEGSKPGKRKSIQFNSVIPFKSLSGNYNFLFYFFCYYLLLRLTLTQ